MKLWTTFAPSKISWEITTIRNRGKAGSSDWLRHKAIIDESLLLLKHAGISGIRLVIFPAEITEDGETFNWKPIDAMLDLCQKYHILVDLCIGPYQYPHYPGIYLPSTILKSTNVIPANAGIQKREAKEMPSSEDLRDPWAGRKEAACPSTMSSGPNGLTGVELRPGMTNRNTLDTSPQLRQYGIRFLNLQLERYGDDPRVRGFHLANEWPDRQAVAGMEQLTLTVSRKFMLEAAALLKRMTDKPTSLNTNIDASDRAKVFSTFNDILTILGEQGKLGFDIYPSQETWRKAPQQKMRRLFDKYSTAIAWCSNKCYPTEIYFAEVEAQPWGSGQSWYRLISDEKQPHEKVLQYTRSSLAETFEKYIAETPCETISLWGSDFWLSAHEMGIEWPMEQIKFLISNF